MTPLEHLPQELDSFWKEALDGFLPDFIELAACDLWEAIDWAAGFRAVERELLPERRDDSVGKRVPDRVFEVRLCSGDRALLLVHVEIQSDARNDFARRMFVYRYRLFDRHQRPVFSIAILADETPRFRPHEFVEECFGTELRFRFRTLKLLDFRDRVDELEASPNPFAFLIAIHLRTRVTQPDRRRYVIKVRLLRKLIEKGWDRPRIARLTQALMWMMMLPREIEDEFRDEIVRIEEETNMAPMTIYEIEALERGRIEGALAERPRARREAIVAFLRARFGVLPDPLVARIESLADVETLDRLVKVAATCADVTGFARALD